MPIPITCASCGTQLDAPDDAVGKTAECPSCGQRLVVPEPLFDAEDFDDIPVEDPPEDRASDRRPCHACGEMIIASAAKCRFCGEIFDPALKRQAQQRAGRSDADLSAAEWFVAILCSGIGCICGIVWMIQGKPKGTKMFLVSLAAGLIWGVIRAALRSAENMQ